MSAATRTRLPMPLRIDDEPWAQPAGDAPVREPAPPSAPLEAWPEEPPVGFVDRLVAVAREYDPDAYAEILPADHETPMAKRIRARLELAAAGRIPTTAKRRRAR